MWMLIKMKQRYYLSVNSNNIISTQNFIDCLEYLKHLKSKYILKGLNVKTIDETKFVISNNDGFNTYFKIVE